MTRIAIIGAGIAGLTLARQLADHAHVTVFEKSRGTGGRMATRSAPPYAFDHGAQFFTAKSHAFQAEVAEWLRQGIVRSWNVRFAEFERDRMVAARDWDESRPHYVGVPGMKHIGKHLAKDVDVQLNTRVVPLQRSGNDWQLCNDRGDELGRYDWVVSTAPAPQTAELLPDCLFKPAVEKPQMLGCYALLLGFPATAIPQIDWQAARIGEADISWAAVNSSKPDRAAAFSMVVHSTNGFAEAHLQTDSAVLQAHLVKELRLVTGIDAETADHCTLHRWRYANTPRQAPGPTLLDSEQKLAACGDWLIHGRVEAAYLSGLHLAAAVRKLL